MIVALVVVVGALMNNPMTTVTPNTVETTTINYMEEIPEKPDNFDIVVRDVHNGKLDLSDVPYICYSQPEFYAESWMGDMYENHDYSRWGVYGHGAYPATVGVEFNKPAVGHKVGFITFYSTGYGIETWQGIKLQCNHKYFDISLTPDEMLLYPTFPKFHANWSRPIEVVITVKEVPPVGQYTIDVTVTDPSEETSEMYHNQVFYIGLTDDQRIMIEECQLTSDNPSNCYNLINTGRRNVYVESGFIDFGSRLKIVVDII